MRAQTSSEFGNLATSDSVKPTFSLHLQMQSEKRPARLGKEGVHVHASVLRELRHNNPLKPRFHKSDFYDFFKSLRAQAEQFSPGRFNPSRLSALCLSDRFRLGFN